MQYQKYHLTCNSCDVENIDKSRGCLNIMCMNSHIPTKIFARAHYLRLLVYGTLHLAIKHTTEQFTYVKIGAGAAIRKVQECLWVQNPIWQVWDIKLEWRPVSASQELLSLARNRTS